MNNLQERYLDLALEELVGELSPPDLRGTIFKERKPRKTRMWGVLTVAASLMICTSILWLIISGGEDPKPAPVLADVTTDRQWLPPQEVANWKTVRAPYALEIFKSDQGSFGIFFTSRETGLSLYVSNLRHPWRRIPLGGIIAGNPVVTGASVQFVVSDWSRKEVNFVRVNLDTGSVKSKIPIPGAFPSNPLYSKFVQRGDHRFVVMNCERGQIVFSRSTDRGRTWEEWKTIGRSVSTDEGICPPLFSTAQGLLILIPEKSGKIVQYVSKDQGKTWKSSTENSPKLPGAMPFLLLGTRVKDSLHVVGAYYFETSKKIRYVSFRSRDEGRTWSKGVLFGSNRPADLAITYHLHGSPAGLVVSYTEPGRSDLHARRAHFFVSRDHGESWREENVLEGIRGDSGRGCAWISKSGEIATAVTGGPEEGKVGPRYFLFRRYGVPKVTSKKIDVTATLVWIDQLGSNSIEKRTKAVQELVAMGYPAIPFLRKRLASESDTEREARIEQVMRQIRLQWPDPSSVPSWWKGAK